MFNAVKDNKLVTAHRGMPKQDAYFCPACNRELILKSGNIRQPYFAHKINCTCQHRDIREVAIKKDKVLAVEPSKKDRLIALATRTIAEYFDILGEAA